MKLAEFALSRKDPGYVQRAKAIQEQEDLRRQGKEVSEEIRQVYDMLGGYGKLKDSTLLGSAIFAVKPGDGSAREQAASCQRVLGGVANVATEYATKRYRSNLINWGMLPLLSKERDFNVGDFLFIENIRESVKRGDAAIKATLIREGQARQIELFMDPLTETEKEIILEGCLINYYAKGL